MLFNSVAFLLFFPTVVVIYFALPHRLRWLWLLAASLFFYMYWKVSYGFLLLATAAVDYLAGRGMGRSRSAAIRKGLLCFSLISNLGILFFFKYYNFFSQVLADGLQRLQVSCPLPVSQFILPVGISFYTFQSLSYTIDVYRGLIPVERHFGRFLLYVTFFPQLVAGPIERAKNLLPQLMGKFAFDYERVTSGLKLMAWGFFKKLVIADRLAVYVNTVYSQPQDFTGWPVWLATYFFAFQIYCDFSGYSDIAIGAARVMGFTLMENFHRPYYAKSIREFWHRWHISLSTWFKDYLYIPLGGNRVAVWRWQVNLFLVFLISGLWHGANWTFLVWGALHGFYSLSAVWTRAGRKALTTRLGLEHRPGLLKLMRVAVTFHLVCFAWIFFRADTLADALTLLKNMLIFSADHQSVALGRVETAVAIGALLILESVQWLQRRGSIDRLLREKPVVLRLAVYSGLLLLILLFGRMETEQQFIYFQF
ncbi:MAG: Peptidoglycan O-acetyltransferase [bacterium ADurb.Bin478]|nr:MAG: Peptidoglycan O-acetyltransferase [bacterium ADurb.Bin478]